MSSAMASLFAGGYIVVPPTWDKTGAADHRAIQAAIAAMTFPAESRSQGTVILSGAQYYFNAPIVIGSETDPSVKSCNLVTVGQTANLTYVNQGEATTQYLLNVHGNTYSPTPRVSGLYLNCSGLCRGLKFNQTYMAGVENTMVFNARQVAVDWVSAWKTKATNLHIWYTDGISLRVNDSQGSIFDNLRISCTSPNSWPDIHDTTVKDHEGVSVQTPEAGRAAIYIRSQDLTFRSLMLEANEMGSLPLCYLSSAAAGIRFTENIYCEGNASADCYFRIAGSASNESTYGMDFRFENVSKHDATALPTFIRTSGYIDRVVVNGIRGTKATSGMTNIIVCDGKSSRLYRPEVRGARLGIARKHQIVSANGGVIETKEPYSIDYQVIE